MLFSCAVSPPCFSLTLMQCDSAAQRMSMFFLWQTELDIPCWSQLQSQWWPRSAHSQVRSHLSPCIVLAGPNIFFSTRTAPPYEELCRPCHLNMAGGLVNVYNVTVFLSVERLNFEPEHLKRYMDCGRWCSQTRCLLPFYPTALCTVTFIKWICAFGKAKVCIMTDGIFYSIIIFSINSHFSLWAMLLTADIGSTGYDLNVCYMVKYNSHVKERAVIITVPTPDISLSLPWSPC